MALMKLILTGVVILIGLSLNWLLKAKLHMGLRRYGLRATQEKFLRRMYVLISWVFITLGSSPFGVSSSRAYGCS